jgi:ABC-2 type transport system permease protein
MTLSDLIAHEWKTRLARPASLASLVLLGVALLYAADAGRVERDVHVEAIARHATEVAAAMSDWREAARRLEAGGADAADVPPWSASAMDVTFASHLPPAPLADFSIGQSDFLPFTGTISLWDPDARLFSRYELDDPVALALGAFDLGRAVILLLPLLLVALSFDVLSAERDANRLAFVVAQGARPRSLVWRRLFVRSAPVVAVTLAIAMLALLRHGGAATLAQRLPAFAAWTACVLLYAAFWLATIAWVAARNGRGEANLVWLILAWAVATLLLPAAAVSVTEAIWPAPSRAAYLARTRAVEVETERAEAQHTLRYALDHPELSIDAASEVPSYFRTAFLVTSAVDAATRQVRNAFERAAAQREEALRMLRYASPAIALHGLFNDLAGTSATRYRRYVAQALAFKASYAERAGPYVVAGRRMPAAAVDRVPAFAFEDEPFADVLARNAGVPVFLALASLVLAWGADRRLRRMAVLAE